MTLGRTSANKLKIKTDGEAGLRAVSCGCCGNCGFDAFSPTPLEGAQKFKYLTVEATFNFSVGGFDLSLQSFYAQCQPYETEDGGTDYSCGYFTARQRTNAHNLNYKATFYNEAGPDGCSCEVLKASGSESYSFNEIEGVTFAAEWVESYHAAYNRQAVDAIWSTEVKGGQTVLKEKTSPATWEYSFCENWDCSVWPLTCFEFYGYAQGGVPTYSQPIQSGAAGFKVQEWTVVDPLQTYSGAWPDPATSAPRTYTFRNTLHNSLKEVWGPDQPEMP